MANPVLTTQVAKRTWIVWDAKMAESPMDADEIADIETPQGGSAVLRDRFLIDGGKPLPAYDSPNARAFAVEDRRDLSRDLFALITTPGVPIRTTEIRRLKSSPASGHIDVVEWGTVFWPTLERRTTAIIFELPMGGPALEQIRRGNPRLTEYDIPRKIIQPLVDGVRHIHSAGVIHRNIRPDNLFFTDAECQEIAFGECVTAPAGFDQPSVFEPIERAVANPAGRGDGTMADDMFALGATLVVIITGRNPIERIKGEDLLFQRLNIGSYATICGNAKIPISLLEPLRGLLADNPEDRWSIDQIDMWLSGLKQTPMQKKSASKGDTPFRFGGRDHVNPRTLAHAFNRQISDAVQTLKDENFHAWLKRSLRADELSETLKGFIDNAVFHKDDYQGTEEHLVARACSVMDPNGPIRYKGMSICIDGFGPMLASEIIRNGNVQDLTELVNRDIWQFWTGNRASFMDTIDIARSFTQMKNWLGINDPGFGLERCLYEMNPGITCQSEYVIEESVINIDALLPALDQAANNADARTKPVDRHVIAFIASRFNEDIAPHLRALASPKEGTSVIGMLSLLAFLQWKLRADPVYGLASWVGGVLGPAINGYHSRTTRAEIEREIPRLVRKGSLPELFDLIDNAEKRQEDQDGYADALDKYIACAMEVEEIEGTGSELTEKAEKTGQKTAAMISILTTMIAVSIVFISEML